MINGFAEKKETIKNADTENILKEIAINTIYPNDLNENYSSGKITYLGLKGSSNFLFYIEWFCRWYMFLMSLQKIMKKQGKSNRS